MLEARKEERRFILWILAMMIASAAVLSWSAFEVAGAGAAIAVFVLMVTWSGVLKASCHLLEVQTEISEIEQRYKEKSQAQKGALTVDGESGSGALTVVEVDE
jgi:hypothetical protein